jgi:hypothetical protein
LVYTVRVDEVGPASIDAEYEFDWSGESFSPVLSVIGQRVVAFPWCYERPFREELQFKTDVLETANGSEQRVAVRKLPRQLFRVKYIIDDDNERQRALNALYGFHGKFFGVPLFHWARPLLQDASATDTTIYVDHSDADFRDTTATKEHTLILWRSPTDFEIVQVALGGLATPGQIDVELPLDQSHDADETYVVPIQFAIAKDPLKFDETQTNVITIDADWISNDYADLGDLSALSTLDGIPILGENERNLIFKGKLPQGFRIDYDLFDSDGGDFGTVINRTVPETLTYLGMEVQTEAAAFALRKILYGLMGRQKSFWLPTFRNDFTITDDIGGADLDITFEENDFHRFAEDAPDPLGGIYIETWAGDQYFKMITATSSPVAGEETLTIDSFLGTPVAVAEIRKASLLVRSRFNRDRITIRHSHIGNYRLRVPVVGVKESA